MKRTALALGILLACAAAPATAAPIVFTALIGNFENPPTGSPGTGTATVILDPDANTLSVEADFSGLLGTTTAAHIHLLAALGDPTGPVATQTPSFIGFPLGVTSGTFSNVYDTTLTSTYRAGFITASGGTTAGAEAALLAGLLDGRAYFNIHTSEFGGGEIRGFLVQAPEPAALVLLALGAAGVIRRRIAPR